MRGKVAPAVAALLLAVSSSLLAACATGSAATTPSGPEQLWRVGYAGYGQVHIVTKDGVTRIMLKPARAAAPAQTHAALVLSQRGWGDFAATIRLRTNQQLRNRHAHPWEVAWILWHYTSDQRFYYIVLKPNGWELGKADPRYPGGQRFLDTAARPVFPPHRWYTVTIVQRGNRVQIAANGHHLVSYTDHQDPYRAGKIGLYTEDASVTFEPLRIGPPA